MKEEEIIKKFKEEMSRMPAPDLSDPEQYAAFCEELSEKTSPKMEGLERAMKRSLASIASRFFG